MWEEFQSMFRLGILHIADGTDHILFLMTLLLASTAQLTNFKQLLIRLLKLVTAFTIGHSLALMAGSFKWVVLPSAPVEVAIALTILLSAIHLLWPIWKGWELLVVLFFGTIHGLAFAGLMMEINEASSILFIDLLGFNLGIEALQVVIMLVFVPMLYCIGKGPWYLPFKRISSYSCIAAGTVWFFERIGWEWSVLHNFYWTFTHWIVLTTIILILAVFSCKFKDKQSPLGR